MKNNYNQIAGKRVERIETISDGVFAIAMTLLVLNITIPSGAVVNTEMQLIKSFIALTPKILSYCLSFITLGIYWAAQSTQFYYINKSDRNLNWINLFFLLFISIIPFTTAFLSQYIAFKFAIFIYWFNISLIGQILGVNWWYAKKNKLVSIENQDLIAVSKAIKQRIIESQTLYTIAALLCFFNTYVSIGSLILVQLNYAFAIFALKKGTQKNSRFG